MFDRYKRGAAAEPELDRAKDAAVRHVVAKQMALGLPLVTDGELRRRNFQESFGSSVSGFEVAAEDRAMEGVNTAPLARAEQNFSAPGPAIVTRRKAVERLALVRNVPLSEYKFASSLTDRPVKMTVLSPDRISQRFDWQNSLAVYRDMDEFVTDVVAITRCIIRELVGAGCRYIQVDAPGYTAYVDEVSLDRMRSRGEDPKRNLERSIAADNAMIEGFDGVTFGIHLCKGNAGPSIPPPARSRRSGIAKGTMTASPNRCSRSSSTIASSSNTTTSAREVSRRSNMFGTEPSRSWAWSPPSGRTWSRRTCSGGASTRRAVIFRSSSWR